MKKPEEIKKGLECCINDSYGCNEKCPYFSSLSNGVDCAAKMHADALAYIQQLEADLKAVKRERDAAVKDLLNASIYDYALCKTCKKGKNGKCKPICTPRRDYEWRGVCPENTEVQDGK